MLFNPRFLELKGLSRIRVRNYESGFHQKRTVSWFSSITSLRYYDPYVKYLISAKLQVRQPLQHLLFKQSKNKSHASMFSLKYLILPLEFIAKSKAKATLKKLKTNAPSLSLNDVIADTNPDIYIYVTNLLAYACFCLAVRSTHVNS